MRVKEVVTALSLLILFDPSPSPDVTLYRCHAWRRAAGRMGELVVAECTVTRTFLGAPSVYEAYTDGALPLGAVVFGCVEAVDYSLNVSECVGGEE